MNNANAGGAAVLSEILQNHVEGGAITRKAIALARHRGMDTSSWESWLRDLFEKAGREPGPDAAIEPLMLW